MKYRLKKYLAIILLLVAIQTSSVPEAVARGAAFSFDSVWFDREGLRVVPEISTRWLTVVFEPRTNSTLNDFAATSDTTDSVIQRKAKAIIKSHDRLTEYLYDPNLAENACFFKMRPGLKLADIRHLINQLSQDRTVNYVHPTIVLNNKTFAFFNTFEMEWKTATPPAQRESLLSASHVAVEEHDKKDNRYAVDVTAIPFFRALNLLAEDIKVLRVTPSLVEIKPSITSLLSLYMSGGNIGDSIPFSLAVTFSDRVSIDPSSIALLNLRPLNLQKELFECAFDPYEQTKTVTNSPIVITGRVKFYAPGEFTIPAIKISYSCPSCPDKTVRSIETEPVLFKVSSIIPTVKSENRLLVPTDPVAPEFHFAALHRQAQHYQWLIIISVAGFVLCAGWLMRVRYKVTVERGRLKERQKDELPAEQLRMLLHAAPTAPHWSYLGEVGALLRAYLVGLYGIDLKYQGGSGKQFMETIRARLPSEYVDPLRIILAAIDDSVSLESEQYQDLDQLQRDILQIVNLTAHNSAAQTSAAHG